MELSTIKQVILPDDYPYDFPDFNRSSTSNKPITIVHGSYKDEKVNRFRIFLVSIGYVLVDITTPKGSSGYMETWVGRSTLKDF